MQTDIISKIKKKWEKKYWTIKWPTHISKLEWPHLNSWSEFSGESARPKVYENNHENVLKYLAGFGIEGQNLDTFVENKVH